MNNEKVSAVIVAAGSGKRMGSQVSKQYMPLQGKPLLYYCLKAFEENRRIDEIVVVVGAQEIEFCKKNIIKKYGFQKTKQVIQGGAERVDSVYEGLKVISDCQIVLIHDGARPFITDDMIDRAIDGAKKYQACVLGIPVKDTIRIADAEGFAENTPDRRLIWSIQTPQAFSYPLLIKAYKLLFSTKNIDFKITDDAMVVETMTGTRIKLLAGSYQNIKITTPEDMIIATAFCTMRER